MRRRPALWRLLHWPGFGAAFGLALLMFPVAGCGRSDASRPALPTSQASPAAEEMFTYTLPPEGKPLTEVIHDAETATGLTLIYGDNEGEAIRRVIVRLAAPVSAPKSGSQEVFFSLLLALGFVVEPLGTPADRIGQLWQRDRRPARYVPIRSRSYVWRGNLAQVDSTDRGEMVTTFPLRFRNYRDCDDEVSLVLAHDGLLDAAESSNTIIAFATIGTLRKIQQVIAVLDVPAAETRPAGAK